MSARHGLAKSGVRILSRKKKLSRLSAKHLAALISTLHIVDQADDVEINVKHSRREKRNNLLDREEKKFISRNRG